MHLDRDEVTPLIAVDGIPRILVGICDATIYHLAGHAVHDVIGEYIRLADAKHPVDLRCYRIANGSTTSCFVMINPDIDHPITNDSVADVGGDCGQHVFIGSLIKYELIVRTGGILGFEVDGIISISKDVVGQASMISMVIFTIVDDDAHGKDRPGSLLEPTVGLERGEVELLLGGALNDVLPHDEVATNETILLTIFLN